MTIGGWIAFITFSVVISVIGIFIVTEQTNAGLQVITASVTVALIFGLFFGIRWYYQNTASGQRAIVDQRSELNNGLERTINVYTANGDMIATYEGQIDIEDNQGGYVMFDFEGKRYMYYNCFVESIAEID